MNASTELTANFCLSFFCIPSNSNTLLNPWLDYPNARLSVRRVSLMFSL